MLYPFYILLGILPSLIWLCYFLRKDVHPESNKMILKIFFWGMLSALPAALIEIGISQAFLKILGEAIFLHSFWYWLLGIALIEEWLKYLVVKNQVINNPEFDEPVDAIIYLIIAALGFAALENILFLWPDSKALLFKNAQTLSFFLQPLSISCLRFVGATFLHALCSGSVGFFLGLAFFKNKLRGKLTFLGLLIASLLHGLYNFSIMEIEGGLKLIIPITVLAGLALLVSFGFKTLSRLKSQTKCRHS